MNDAVYKLKRMIMSHIQDIRLLTILDDVYRIFGLLPAFFLYVLKSRVLRTPYFGIWMGSEQGNPLRFPFMRAAAASCARERISSEESQPFKLMEIGAYAGASAIQFARSLSEQVNGQYYVYSVDPWDSYLDVTKNRRVQYHVMNYNLANGNVLRLFIRNVRAAGVASVCRQLRGRSEEVLPMLQDQQFDFIYIDGDHAPEAVGHDLRMSARLLKPGGFLSGDDLELQMDELDTQFVRENADRDIALDPQSGRVFHPGVAIAVHEFFGRRITSYDGFWVVRWTGESFEDVVLDDRPNT